MEKNKCGDKTRYKDLPYKERFALATALGAFCVGWLLTIICFFLPPQGEVSESALWILSQALIYTGSVTGFATYINSEQKKLRKDLQNYLHDELNSDKNTYQ